VDPKAKWMYKTELTRHESYKDNLLGMSPVKSERKRHTDTFRSFMDESELRAPLESVRTTHLPGQVGFLCKRPEYTGSALRNTSGAKPSKATFDEHHVSQG